MSRVTVVILLFLVSLCSALLKFPKIPVQDAEKSISQVTLMNCGIPKISYRGGDRIVGGRDAVDGEFPWQVSLRYKNAYIRPTHMCGASVLNSKWIVTAAHCVYGRSPANFEVAVGVYKQGEKSRYSASYQISKIINHEKFDPDTFENDIALLQLEKEIAFRRSKGYVNGICLPSRDFNATGFAITTGWGATKEDGDMTDTLQAVELPIVPHYICEILFGGDGLITGTMLCAGEPLGGVDSCQGDSGGPLVQSNHDGKYTLIGIVSWGVGCAQPGFPGVYTSVASFVEWIEDHTA